MSRQGYIHLQQQTAELEVSLRAPVVHLNRFLVRPSGVLVLWRAGTRKTIIATIFSLLKFKVGVKLR